MSAYLPMSLSKPVTFTGDVRLGPLKAPAGCCACLVIDMQCDKRQLGTNFKAVIT